MNNFMKLVGLMGVDGAVKFYMENDLEVPSPEGYGPVNMCSTIGVFSPWIRPHGYKTMLNDVKVEMIKQFAGIAPIKTAIELGVYTGGVSRLLLDMGFDVYSCDTFEGIAGSGDEDIFTNGDLSAGDVSEYIKGSNIIKGELPGSIKSFCDKLGFIHFDLDVYKPTKVCLDILWPMLVDNGIIIFDDYGGWVTPGVKKAVDEFEKGRKIYLPTGQMVVIK